MTTGTPVPVGSRADRGSGRLGITIAVAVAWVVVDQLSKTWALRTLDDRTIDVFWTLRFNLAFNSGMAFSQGDGLGPVIGVVALLVIVVLLLSLRRGGSLLSAVAVGMIVGGALGNIVDRLFRSDGGFLQGRVVDFIDFQWWPIFNVADIGIVVGGVLLLLSAVVDERRHRSASPT